MSISEFKRDLPALLGEVAKGATILVQKGRRHENVAMLVPFSKMPHETRPLGLLAERGKPVFKEWEMTEEDLLAPH